MKSLLSKAAFAASLVLTSTGAVAADAPEAGRQYVSSNVSIAGLDLRSAEGIALLDARIARNVRQLCGGTWSRDLSVRQDQMRCRREAMQSARPQVELAVAKMRNERYAGDPAAVAMVTSKPKALGQ